MVLDRALRLLREEIAPRAQEIDQSEAAVAWALGRFSEEGLMALRRPLEYGGPAISDDEFRRFQEEIARASGTLAFLQTQHQSAVGMIAGSDNLALKREYLPRMANGERNVGIGFSQLRRSGSPLMKAVPQGNDYVLTGHVPWVTGESYYPEFLIGAQQPDGSAVFGVVPLSNQPGITVSQPMRLAAMEMARTVTVDFDAFVMRADRVAFMQPEGWIARNDQINIALQSQFATGCTLAALDVLRVNAARKGNCALEAAFETLSEELERCREATRTAQRSTDESTTRERLAVRAWIIDLMGRAAHAAVTSSSGAANSISHPAQRIYREAIVFTVSAQTTPIMEATLSRIVGRI